MRYFLFLLVAFLVMPEFSQAYRAGEPDGFSNNISDAAIERTKSIVIYNGAYRKLAYPNGDVPKHFGVCTDLVIRAYRKLGVDLQKDIHIDIKSNFNAYPKKWD